MLFSVRCGILVPPLQAGCSLILQKEFGTGSGRQRRTAENGGTVVGGRRGRGLGSRRDSRRGRKGLPCERDETRREEASGKDRSQRAPPVHVGGRRDELDR